MPGFVALLKGVNVGRSNRVPMAELGALLEALGCTKVRTLLNSGNAIFLSRTGGPRVHAERIHRELALRLGVDVPVIVKSAKQIADIVAGNILAAQTTDASRLLVAFTSDAKSLENLDALASLVKSPERLHLGEHAAYLWCHDGILQSKAGSALLGKFGQAATTRNWATVLKIRAMLCDTAA